MSQKKIEVSGAYFCRTLCNINEKTSCKCSRSVISASFCSSRGMVGWPLYVGQTVYVMFDRFYPELKSWTVSFKVFQYEI